MAADPKGRLGGTSRTPESRPVVAVKEVDLEAIPAWVVPYKVASPRRPPKGVDPGQPEAIPYLKATIEEVVSFESPVHRDQIEARIREVWGFRKIGSQIRKQVDEAFKRARVNRDGDFYYQDELSDWYEVPTRTHDLASKRDISQIHAREIQDTCWRIVRDATAVDIEQVIPLAARYLGIQQVRTATSEALRKAVDDLCVRGHLELGEDGLLRVDEPPDE